MLWAWALFGVLVLSALAFDLGLLTRSGRQQHELSIRAATARSYFGARLLLGDVLEVPTAVPLGVIAAALTLSIAVSIKWPGASHSPA
jgi:hypothetical protein